MSAPAVIARGKAVIEGCAGTWDALLYQIAQSGKATQNFEEEIIKDVHGYDAVWVARNEHLMCDWALKLVGDTAAHAAVTITAVAAAGTVAGTVVSDLGQPFMTPFSKVVFTATGTTPASYSGSYQVISGQDVDLGNTKVADLNLKLRRYANSDQATASTAVPA